MNNPIIPEPAEVERRLRKVMMLNRAVRALRAAALEAHERGELKWKPLPDIRIDGNYWREVARSRETPTAKG